jgi:predicted acyltransferase
MFWIVGGAVLLRAIANWSGSEPFIQHATEQTTHTPWIGCTLYDLIFPLFLFISGVAIPYSLTAKIANGTLSKTRAYFRVLRRFILLTALGLSFTFLSFDPEQFRIPGVLQLIAGGYLIAAVLAIHRPARSQFIWALGILIGYWLALTFIPVPGGEAGQLTPGGNLAAYLDRLLPGTLYMGVFDPEGPVRYLPAAAMALLGSVTGSFLQSREKASHGAFIKLLLAGLVAGGLGWSWGLIFPIIKPLWTSSYVLLCAGCSLVLLSVFYLVIDVWKQRWLAFIWLPLGMNAITIYVLVQFVSFRTISENILGGYAGTLPDHPAEFTLALGTIVIEWIILFYLFRKKTLLRA